MSEAIEVTIVDEPSKQLTVLVQSTGLEAQSAQSVLDSFVPLLKQAGEWKAKVALIKVTDVSQTREMKLAHETRMALREIRIKAEKARKLLKEDSLRRGKAIDGAYNIVEFLIAPLEKTLLDQEQFAKNKETERKVALKRSRTELITPHLQNPITELYGMALEDLSEETFAELLDLKKTNHHARLNAALELHEANVARQKAEAAEQERIRKENELLKQQAADKEAALQAERAAQAKKDAEAAELRRKEDAERLRKEAEAAEVLRQQRLKEQAAREIERQRAEAEKAEIQRKADEATKAARALQAKLDAEAAAKRARDAADALAARKAATAPDREKLKAVAEAVRRTPLPAINAKDILPNVAQALTEVAAYIDELAEQL